MRAVIVSHLYADPANRAKLRCLAGLGVSLAVAVPDRWAANDRRIHGTTWTDDTGVRVIPVSVRGRMREPNRLQWNTKTLRRLLTDFRPDLLHIEEEPWTQPASVALRLARRLGIRSVLSTAESLPQRHGMGQRFRRERSLRLAQGIMGAAVSALRFQQMESDQCVRRPPSQNDQHADVRTSAVFPGQSPGPIVR